MMGTKDEMPMTKYEKLMNEVHESDVMYVETESEKIPAQAFRIEDDFCIFFNESAFETDAERLVALDHEKSHCDTGTLYSADAPRVTKMRCEAKAWKRTIENLLPFNDEFVEAFNSCKFIDGFDIYEFAEKLDVTPNLAIRAIEYHYYAKGKRW